MNLNESTVEAAALEWFASLGYAIGHGPHMAPGEPAAERDSFGEVVLIGRLRAAIARLNPTIPEEAREDALRRVLHPETPAFTHINRRFHRLLRDGVEVEYRRADGSIAGDRVRLVDFVHPSANDLLAVNQFTVIEAGRNRRPDIVVFINGLPLGVIELKNAADEDATIWDAFKQVQTYKAEIPSLLHFNEVLIVSDGLQARIGSLTANEEWFKVWRTIEGERDAPKTALELEVTHPTCRRRPSKPSSPKRHCSAQIGRRRDNPHQPPRPRHHRRRSRRCEDLWHQRRRSRSGVGADVRIPRLSPPSRRST